MALSSIVLTCRKYHDTCVRLLRVTHARIAQRPSVGAVQKPVTQEALAEYSTFTPLYELHPGKIHNTD